MKAAYILITALLIVMLVASAFTVTAGDTTEPTTEPTKEPTKETTKPTATPTPEPTKPPAGATETDVLVKTDIPHVYDKASITSAKLITDTSKSVQRTITVQFRNDGKTSGTVVEYYCRDNTGQHMPVWGGMAYGKEGAWSFDARDTLPHPDDDCYFAVIDADQREL